MAAFTGLTVCALLSCQRLTETVLVVDTDMTVPEDLDSVTIAVEGNGPVKTFDAKVAAAGGPRFPLTLGLVGDNGAVSFTVVVNAFAQSSPVLTQTVRTSFVEGERRLLRIVLSTACLPVVCEDEQTCDGGTCQSRERPGRSLPPWAGVVPPRPEPPPVPPGRSVWASGWHSAAIEGTTLYAWGEGSDGQLGIGTTQNAKTRRPVMRVQGPLSVGLGLKHSCVCDRDRRGVCWGRNVDGQLGTGSTTPELTVPTVVPGMTDCLEIAGGGSHTCAVRTDNTLACWGVNSHGQVGQPAGGVVTAPWTVTNLVDVVQVGAGDRHTCALRKDGGVLCWGDNNLGQLGDGTNTARANPAPVMGLTDAVEIAVGRVHACARRTSGVVVCWGSNDSGQLGNGGSANSSVPTEVMGLVDASQLATGHLHSCALSRVTKQMACWGRNNAGQLGVPEPPGSPLPRSMVPVQVSTLYDVTSIAAGSEHTCARHNNNGALSCWGDNFVNQLGEGSTTGKRTPVSVAGF